MELVKVQLARSIILFDTQELNPSGLTLYPEVYVALAKRYQFNGIPKADEIQSGASLYFKHGRFTFETGPVEVDFDFHSDGLVATTRHSTEASDAFQRDFLDWMAGQLGVAYPPSLVKKRIHRSEMVVKMKANLEGLAEKANPVAELLAGMSNHQVRVTGVTFGAGEGKGIFSLERRVDTPFDDNRYFSAATLATSQHVEVLAKFEQMML